MRASVPVLSKDPEVAECTDLPLTEPLVVNEPVLLDGPAARPIHGVVPGVATNGVLGVDGCARLLRVTGGR